MYQALLPLYYKAPVALMSEKKIQDYLQSIAQYEQWRNWSGKWLLSWQVLTTFSDPKQNLVNAIKKTLTDAKTQSVEIIFKKLIEIYIQDIKMEFDLNSSIPGVNGGNLRKVLADILMDIFSAHVQERDQLKKIISEMEAQFEDFAGKFRSRVFITPGRFPISIEPQEELLESYEPISFQHFSVKFSL